MMQEHPLSFGVIRLLNSQIAEVVVDDDIELTLERVAECHEFLINHLPQNAGALINQANRYSYSFDALQHFFVLENVRHFAVLVHNHSARLATETLLQLQRDATDLEIFENFDKALHWLCEHVDCPVPDVGPQYFPKGL